MGTQVGVGVGDLSDDLAGDELSFEAELTSGAEGAAHRAPRLTADAERGASRYPMRTVSTAAPSGARNSHLTVRPPSPDCSVSTRIGQSRSVSDWRSSSGRLVIASGVSTGWR